MSENHDTLVKCTDCRSYVELTRDENGKLTLTCDCGEQRRLKVKMALPDGWQP